MPPEVVITPTQTVAYVGTDAAIVAAVLGNDFYTLQWRHNGTNISGATDEILELVNLNAAAAGRYDVVASTIGGTSTSSVAGLTISGAVELVGVTPHRSSPGSWDYAPQFHVSPDGEFIIAARSNDVTHGSSILIEKHDAAGALLWSTVFDSPEFTNAEPSHLAVDRAGNIYVNGQSLQPNVAAALVVLKYNPDGQLLWSRILAGTNVWGSLHPFAVDPSGNSAIGVLGAQGVTLIRYNSAGDVQWSYDDPSPDNDSIAVAVDAFGNSYLGTTIRVGGDNEIRLRKFDSTGATAWTKPDADGIYNRLGAIAVDSAGNLIVAGTGEFADVPDSRMFVQKYSLNGQKLWETRTGSTWREIGYIVALAVGPEGEITVLTLSDDDYEPGEQSGLTRISANGQLRYRIGEPQIFVRNPSQLALDNFGNAYITGHGGRVVTGIDAVTAKYDANGSRLWMVYHGGRGELWETGLALGTDAAGDVRVLASESNRSDAGADFSVLHYRQRDPAAILRVRVILDAAGTFHLGTPAGISFQIEDSTDLQNWSVIEAADSERLMQPGATPFGESPRRFFRLISTE
jgi:hypothetical protein